MISRLALFIAIVELTVTTATSSFAQMTFSDVASYCRTVSEASTPTLLARTLNLPRAQAEALMQGMTDPAAIRMVKEVIAFAWSRPPNTPVETMRSELYDMCIARKIFVQ